MCLGIQLRTTDRTTRIVVMFVMVIVVARDMALVEPIHGRTVKRVGRLDGQIREVCRRLGGRVMKSAVACTADSSTGRR